VDFAMNLPWVLVHISDTNERMIGLIKEAPYDLLTKVRKTGSAPESDKIGISSCFPESHKFGSGCG